MPAASFLSRDALSLSEAHFTAIRDTLYVAAGITLAAHKRQMVENRIAKRLKDLNLPSFDAYIAYVQDPHHQDEMVQLINALTTNVTHFFREAHHFEHLRGTLTHLLDGVNPKIRLWSAGCSIGAEPYSAAMVIQEVQAAKGKRGDIRILATDIDTVALARARAGAYPERIAKGLTPKHIERHFTKTHDGQEPVYTVKDNLRRLVAFNHFNLNDAQWPMQGPFDVIFCRNVLIYFKRDKQREYVTKLLQRLRVGGFLYLGHSEHAVVEGMNLLTLGQTIYQKQG